MKILVTGAKGFVGKNLCRSLECIKDGRDKTRPELKIDEIFEYDIDTDPALLDGFCKDADFVFNLAGVNRPQNSEEFMQGNFGFASTLLDTLKKHKNTCPVMISSSTQATCIGRYDSDYGRSKKAGEELMFEYGKETGAKVLVYRFPNLFGKWCRPNYNSAVATFCNNIANDLPIQVNDRNARLELLYIDDLVYEMLDALEGKEHSCEFDGIDTVLCEDGRYCAAPVSHKVTLGEIVDLLYTFKEQTSTLLMPEIPNGSFAKKLYSTYLSYLPREKAAFELKMNVDARGSFTELLKTEKCGQFSVNISKPGITKGQHWHHTKWEFFIVVSGRGLIQQRKIGTDEVLDFHVSGDKIEAVHMLPGYTHNIINLSETESLVTVMWANEQFEANRPDTFFEVVEPSPESKEDDEKKSALIFAGGGMLDHMTAGKGLVRQRKIGTDEVLDFHVSGDEIQAVEPSPEGTNKAAKKSVLIFGGGGMAGHVVANYLSENGYDLTVFDTASLDGFNCIVGDATDFKQVEKAVFEKQYTAVINCIGILNRACDEHVQLAIRLNSELPHFLEELLKNTRTKLVHISSDCVFSGQDSPYTEDDIVDAEDNYGRTKAMGEVNNSKDITFRTSIVGPDINPMKNGLVNWFVQQQQVRGFTKMMWTGVSTITLAKAMKAAIEQDVGGIYHLVNNTVISKCDLLGLFNKHLRGGEVKISAEDGIEQNKIIKNTRTDFDFKVPSYEEMTAEIYQWIKDHREMYGHYSDLVK